jgi:hypothetical protein
MNEAFKDPTRFIRRIAQEYERRRLGPCPICIFVNIAEKASKESQNETDMKGRAPNGKEG